MTGSSATGRGVPSGITAPRLVGESEVEPGEAIVPRLPGNPPLELVPRPLAAAAGLGEDLQRRQRLLEGDVDRRSAASAPAGW